MHGLNTKATVGAQRLHKGSYHDCHFCTETNIPAIVLRACSTALHCHAVQGGIDTSVYSRRIQAQGSLRSCRRARTPAADLRGAPALLRELELLACDQPMSGPINIMLAFQIDQHLLPLQFPVQLRASSNRYEFRVRELLGCSSLIHHTTITGCCRWMPAAVNDAARGYEPGLLVINLSTKLSSCDLGAATTPAPTHQQVRSAGPEGDPGSQQASELQLHTEGMKGEEVGKEEAGGMSQEGGLGQDGQQDKGQTLHGRPKRLRTGTGTPEPAATAAAAHVAVHQVTRGRPLPVDTMGEGVRMQKGTTMTGVIQRTGVVRDESVTGAQPLKAGHRGPQVRCAGAMCLCTDVDRSGKMPDLTSDIQQLMIRRYCM
jgi:hypothetical protein